MREGHDIPHNLARHGSPGDVADALDVGANADNPRILRAALINALCTIAVLDRRLSEVEARTERKPAP